MTEFTQGKWVYAEAPNDNGEYDIFSTKGKEFVFIGTCSGEANARLIAHAPELYELVMDELRGEAGGMLSFSREAKVRRVIDSINGDKNVQE